MGLELEKEQPVRGAARCFHMPHACIHRGRPCAHCPRILEHGCVDYVFHAQTHGRHIHTYPVRVLQGHMWVSTWAHVWPRAVSTLVLLSLVSLPLPSDTPTYPCVSRVSTATLLGMNAAYAPEAARLCCDGLPIMG